MINKSIIESSVDKIEKIYNIFLNKMFGMVGEIFDDYRKHVWSDKGMEGWENTKKVNGAAIVSTFVVVITICNTQNL